MARADHAVRCCTIRYSTVGRCTYRARNGKRTQIKKIERVALVIDDRPNYIRPIKGVTAAAVVILEVVVEVEGLAALQSGNTVNAPSVLQLLHAAAHGWEVVGEIPSQAVRDVEVGRTVFELRLGAVVGLSGVGFEIFAVAGVVERFRPYIIQDRSYAVPSGDTEAGLERIVVRFAGRVLLQYVVRTIRVAVDGPGGRAKVVNAVAGDIRRADLSRAGLCIVDEAPQAIARRTHVTDLYDCLVGDLLLDVQVVVLHVRRLDVAVETEGVALVTATRRGLKDRDTSSDRPAHNASRTDGGGSDVVICGTRIKEWCVG